jgi:uroporphyrinogen-III synthase
VDGNEVAHRSRREIRRDRSQTNAAPAIRLVPLHDDLELQRATRAVLATTVDVAVATGVGFRGWIEAAEGWGLGEPLREHLARERIVTRGPKATGAVRAAGLRMGGAGGLADVGVCAGTE